MVRTRPFQGRDAGSIPAGVKKDSTPKAARLATVGAFFFFCVCPQGRGNLFTSYLVRPPGATEIECVDGLNVVNAALGHTNPNTSRRYVDPDSELVESIMEMGARFGIDRQRNAHTKNFEYRIGWETSNEIFSLLD